MKAKPVIPREQAQRDVDEAIAYYLAQDGGQAALGLIDALERAYAHISRHPASGSPRYGQEFDLPGVRVWPVSGFPWLVFYVERTRRMDVLRILHGERDIPASLRQQP